MGKDRVALALVILGGLMFTGCGATRRSGQPIEESGFLCDYSLLDDWERDAPKGEGPRARRRYLNPNADWKAYDRVLVDPVVFFSSKDVEPPREMQAVLNYFWAELKKELAAEFEVVDSPGPRTLRITMVVTRAGKRNVTMDKISTFVPFGRALAELQGASAGKPSFVGYAKIEAKIENAETDELLGAATDKRVGGKTLKGFDSWSDVRAAIDYWAKLFVVFLRRLRGDDEAKAPERPEVTLTE